MTQAQRLQGIADQLRKGAEIYEAAITEGSREDAEAMIRAYRDSMLGLLVSLGVHLYEKDEDART